MRALEWRIALPLEPTGWTFEAWIGIANSIWYNNGFTVLPTFSDTVRHYFDAEVRQMNVDYILRLRKRFADWLDQIIATRPAAGDVDIEGLADNLTAIIEGAIILSKALADEGLMGRQTRLFRDHIKLIFGA